MPVIPNAADRAGMDGDAVVLWAGLRAGDSGAPLALSASASLHVQVTGNISTGAVAFQGSNAKSPSGNDWSNLVDKTGVPLIFNSTSSFKVSDSVPRWVRPAIEGDDAMLVDVSIMVRAIK